MMCINCGSGLSVNQFGKYFNLFCSRCDWEQHQMYDNENECKFAYLFEINKKLAEEIKKINAWTSDHDMRNRGEL